MINLIWYWTVEAWKLIAENWFSEVINVNWMTIWDLVVTVNGTPTWDVKLQRSFNWTDFFYIDWAVITLDWTEAANSMSRSITINSPMNYIRLENKATWWTINVYLSYTMK